MHALTEVGQFELLHTFVLSVGLLIISLFFFSLLASIMAVRIIDFTKVLLHQYMPHDQNHMCR
ncbi:MAG: hypothetical protein NVS4B12_17330 [Ktedonobacteraceae bacterium]